MIQKKYTDQQKKEYKALKAYNRFIAECNASVKQNIFFADLSVLMGSVFGFFISSAAKSYFCSYLFLGAFLVLVLSFFTGNQSIKKGIIYAEQYYLFNDDLFFKKKSRWTKFTGFLNTASFVICAVGLVVFLVTF
jgi:hypothetical protein